MKVRFRLILLRFWSGYAGFNHSILLLQLMEKNGLILRESAANDARMKSLIPTDKAANLDAQIGEYLRQTEQKLTSGLSSAQIALFQESAARMYANLNE